jgi:aspartate/methionine/tyrosine aminotransferase
MGHLGTETAFEVLARARELEAQGREIIHLEIGKPDFDTPPHIVQAAVQALHQGHTHYTPAPGIPELRAVVAEEVARTRRIAVDPGQVIITPGAKPIMFFSLLALCQEGDEVIYPNPGFPIYESMIHFVGAVPVPFRLREEDGFGIDRQEFPSLVTPVPG